MLDLHLATLADIFAEASAGRSIAARIAMMAMTTSNSINVNALDYLDLRFIGNFSS